jgi:hypothetical protein
MSQTLEKTASGTETSRVLNDTLAIKTAIDASTLGTVPNRKQVDQKPLHERLKASGTKKAVMKQHCR